jgi:hypothetical protein
VSRWAATLVGMFILCSGAIAQSPPADASVPPPSPTPEPVVSLPVTELRPPEPTVSFIVPGGPRPGLFGSIDLSLLFPHLRHDVQGSVRVRPFKFVDDVRVPAAPLDATLAPKLTLGWRFADNRGAVQATFRNLTTEGSDFLPSFGAVGDASIWTRVDLNEVGLNYSTQEHPLGALWAFRWEFGARLASIYSDSSAFGNLLSQRTTNHFVGAGPQVAFDLTREFPDTGFALFSRIDAADYLGRIEQSLASRVGERGVPFGLGATYQDGSQAVPYLGAQAGLSWLSQFGHYRVTAGYEFNQWWNIARIGDSRGYLQAQGLFLRAEFNY